MSKNNLVETIYLNKAEQRRARSFAQKRVDAKTELYQKRGGFKKEDIISGAMAEIAVYNLLKSHGVRVEKPDFTIHEVRKKSFDPDLSDGLHHFHVKGQTLESKQKYGASWIMQRTDPIINKPQRLHYIVPCTVDIHTGRVEVYGIMSILSLVQLGCIGECKLEWFRKTKVALYMDHIEPFFSEKARWGFFDKWKDRWQRHGGEL
jgi:hypothetical protein